MKLKRIFSLLLLCIVGGASVGCAFLGGNTDSSGEEGSSSFAPTTSSNKKPLPSYSSQSSQEEIEETEHMLVSGGKMDYKVVIEDEATQTEKVAANDLINLIDQSTNNRLPVITESRITYSDDANLIILGDTQFSEEAGVDVSDIPSQGFTIKTVGTNVFILGENEGVQYGAYEFMHQSFGFEFFLSDDYVLDKNVKELPLFDFNFSDSPDILHRAAGWDQILSDSSARYARVKHMDSPFMRQNTGMAHNTFGEWFPKGTFESEHPKWYSDNGDQLCYTAHGDQQELMKMQTTLLQKMQKFVDDYYGRGEYLTAFAFTQEDTATWCECSACNKLESAYKTNSAAVIKFLNPVARSLKSWLATKYPGREVTITFFAYNETESAPVKTVNGQVVPIDDSVVMEDNLAVLLALIRGQYIYNIYDSQNDSMRALLEGWQKVAKKFYCWGYDTNFRDFLIWNDTMNELSDYYKYMRDLGVEYMFNQGQVFNKSTSTGFDNLKIYLNHKLMWDVDLNVGELTQFFFDNYFGYASKPMMDYYMEFRSWSEYWKEQRIGGGVYYESYNKNHYPKRVLMGWLEYIEKAYESIEKLQVMDKALYTELYDRICLESLAIRYYLIQYHGTTFVPMDLKNMKLTFKEDAVRLGLTRQSETYGSMQTVVYSKWGI